MKINNNELMQWIHGLYEIGQSAAMEKSALVHQKLLDYFVDGFNAQSGCIAVFDDKQRLEIIAGSGSVAKYIGENPSLDDCVLGWVIKNNQQVKLLGNVSDDSRFKHIIKRQTPRPYGSSMCWPMVANKNVIGAVSVNRNADHESFSDKVFQHGEVIVGILSLLVDNVRMHEAQKERIENLCELNEELVSSHAELAQVNLEKEANEIRLQTILDIAPEAIIVVDADQRITNFNKGAETIFGFNAHEMVGQPLIKLLPKHISSMHRNHVETFANSLVKQKIMESRAGIMAVRKDGSEFPAGVSISKVMQNGKYIFTAILRDLTEELAAKQALSNSEERLRISQEFSNIGNWDWDIASGSFHWSDNVWKIFGYSQREGETRFEDYLNSVYPDDRITVSQAIKNCVENINDYDIEHRIVWPDKSVRWVQARGGVLRDVGGRAFRMLGVVQDITEQKDSESELANTIAQLRKTNLQLHDAQQQLLQSEKMASIGQLAAGVAHEINNPVGYINSNLGALKRYLDDLFKLLSAYEKIEPQIPDANVVQSLQDIKTDIDVDYLKQDLKELLSESEEGVTRVRQIVQDLKDFSHVDEAEWQWASVHKGLDSTLNIVKNEIKYKADVVREYGEIPDIECIIAQLNQVFMNLLVNAAHAIEEHGVIHVRTGADAENIWIEIEDNGKGMDAQTVKKIFDPFFTTKPIGKGTGLGLSLSYGIIQKHNGTISVESEPGKGTKFRILLPITSQQLQAAG